MKELEQLKERLTERALKIVDEAVEESKKRQHYYLGVEHIFLAFAKVEEDFFKEIMDDLSLDTDHVLNFLNEHLNITRQYIGVGLKVPPATRNIFKLAWEEAQKTGRDKIDSGDLIIAIFQENHSLPPRIFRSFGLDPDFVMSRITVKIKTREQSVEEGEKKYDLPANLKHFAVNLNKLARKDKLPLIIGRDAETRQIMEILCHVDRANSVMLIGEPGVGKTAVAEGLARLIELTPESVPPRLRGKQIINLQMNSIIAGTMFRGMFEDRLEKIIKEIKENKNFILFIDEAHTIIGAGSAMGVPSDAANIFKSTLTRGELQIIGATTLSEYKQFFAQDEALSRRFRSVLIKEPSLDETRAIIYGIRPRLEKNYSVSISDEAIECAIDMSKRYMRGLKLPDKAIGWLDTASVKVEINRPGVLVGASDVIEVISQESNIPIDMVVRDTVERFKDMESALSERIIGQRPAIEAVSKRLRLNKGPLKENFFRPDGVLLFLGPTGVGKTELAKATADFLFGDDTKIIRLDMSEYKDGALSVDKLIGMPHGIVGSERGGILTTQVRDNPYSVVLLDEVEKAHPYVLNLFLQIFDEGFLTDGRGKKVYFSDTIIILTSNLGSDEFKRYLKPLGYLNESGDTEGLEKNIMNDIEKTFSPEFLNRIDDIVVFSPLSKAEVKRISAIYLRQIARDMAELGKKLDVTPEAIDRLVDLGYSQKYGARFLKRKIDDLVKIPVTHLWKDGDNFNVRLVDSKLVVGVEGMREPVLM